MNIRMNDLVVVLHDVWLSIVAQHLTFRVSTFMIPEGLSFGLMFEVSLGRNNLSMDYLILTLLDAHRLFIMGKALFKLLFCLFTRLDTLHSYDGFI